MARDPAHDLPLGFRCRLMMSEWFTPEKRLEMSVLTSKHVLEIWDSGFPDNSLPRTLLERIERWTRGELDRESLRQHAWSCHRELENLVVQPRASQQTPVIAGFSAVYTAWLAVGSPYCDLDGRIDTETDSRADPWGHDAAFFACAAFSGGTVWEPESDPNRRREFWLWWLEAARHASEGSQ